MDKSPKLGKPRKTRRALSPRVLVAALGDEDAMKLMRDYAGHRMPSPAAWHRHERDSQIFAEWMKGSTVAELSVRHCMQPMTTYKVLSRARLRGKASPSVSPEAANRLV